jgi:hypothetical protein
MDTICSWIVALVEHGEWARPTSAKLDLFSKEQIVSSNLARGLFIFVCLGGQMSHVRGLFAHCVQKSCVYVRILSIF